MKTSSRATRPGSKCLFSAGDADVCSDFELKLEDLKFDPTKFIIDFSHALASKRVAGASQSTSQRQCQEVLC